MLRALTAALKGEKLRFQVGLRPGELSPGYPWHLLFCSVRADLLKLGRHSAKRVPLSLPGIVSLLSFSKCHPQQAPLEEQNSPELSSPWHTLLAALLQSLSS